MKQVAIIEFVGTGALTKEEFEKFITVWNMIECEMHKGEKKEASRIEVMIGSD